MKKYIPNFLTLLNLLCGTIAVIHAVLGQLEITALFVFLGIFFDFFDGFAARKLEVQSEIGLQLDSLADMVTSGVVPGIVMYRMLQMGMEAGSWSDSISVSTDTPGHLVPFLGLLIPLASAYRLAKFNTDDNQVSSFTGLSTPANTLFVLSLPLILIYQGSDILYSVLLNPWVLVAVTLLSCYLLNANIRLFALKFKTWGLRENVVKYTFLAVCALLLALLKFVAIPIIILLYITVSVVENNTASRQTERD